MHPRPAYPRMPMLEDMRALVGQYEYGMKARRAANVGLTE